MLLSNTAILRNIKKGNIVIDPFRRRDLKTTSYDIRLGEWFWREENPRGRATMHNVYDEDSVKDVWRGPFQAELSEDVAKRIEIQLKNIKPSEKLIILAPGETILGHTEEFIGGRNICVAKMYARSSLGRNFIEVCKDAGWGDVGYINRWTMEITNNSKYFSIPLVVGRRVAQMVFYEVEPPVNDQDYAKDGKYQSETVLTEIKKSWSPYMMTPRMHLDYEVKEIS